MAGFAIPLALAAAALPANEGCVARMGALAAPPAALPAAVDGNTLRKPADLGRLRSRTRDGSLILVDGGRFDRWDFRKLRLGNICFRNASLKASDWRGLTAPGIGFIDSDLSGAQMQGAQLPGLLLRTTILADVDLSGADLTNGRLDGGWNGSLARTRLDGARLREFSFVCGVSEADGCPFDRQGLTAKAADFSNARFTNFSFVGAARDDAVFEGAEMGLDDLGQLDGARATVSVTIRRAGIRLPVTGTVARSLAQMSARAVEPDCANPATPLDTALCADGTGELARTARDVARLEAAAAADPAARRFAAVREACLARPEARRAACLGAAHAARRAALAAQGGLPPPGGHSLLVIEMPDVGGTLVQRPDWPEMAAVYARLNPGRLLLRGGVDGKIAARAVLTRADASRCTIDLAGLVRRGNTLRPGVASGGAVAPTAAEITPQGLLLLPDAMARAGCPGISLPAMRVLPIDKARFEELWQEGAVSRR